MATIVNDATDAFAERPYLKFPPFPSPPDGVSIIPFKHYRETGIQLFGFAEDEEVDGLGIPTVELTKKHDTDECKTSAKRKRKQKKVNMDVDVSSGRRKEWWEQWAQAEDLRVTSVSYDPNMSRVDRVFQAAADFRIGRSWPPQSTGVRSLWDQFRLFVGLLSNTPIWHRTDEKRAPSPDEADFSDEEFGGNEKGSKMNMVVEDEPPNPSQKKWPARPRPRPPYANFGETGVPVNNNDDIRDLLDQESVRKDDKLAEFLNDPETAIKVFLSSYIRKQGLIWSDRNLLAIPRLVGFFLTFLLRNRVLPEATYERGLRRALVIVDLAKEELPLTSKIAKIIPDDLHSAFQECWGRKADGYKQILPLETPNEGGEPEPKKQRLDGEPTSPVDQFVEELKAANVEVINPLDIPVDIAKEVAEDNMDTGGWGSNSGGWGDAPASLDDSFPQIEVDPWGPPEPHSLLKWLGPSVLPLTHTTGVVEWSLRRIKALIPPAVPVRIPGSRVGNAATNPEGVELELDTRFAKVILEPWTGWDSLDEQTISTPRILESSRGTIEVSPDSTVTVQRDDIHSDDANINTKPHNPLKDNINLLVEASHFSSLHVGMGLGATWVQIVRLQEDGDAVDGEGAKKKTGKGKGKQNGEGYWYMEELMMIFPSYYTA